MATPLEQYALIGDMHTAALVGRDGSIDWLCLPRFDSDACFAALLGDHDNGHWTLAPKGAGTATRRAYRDDTLVLRSEWDTSGGSVRVTDFMPPRTSQPDVVRIVEGLSGEVEMRGVLRLRFGYGHDMPWAHRVDHQLTLVCGPDSVWLKSDVPLHGRDFATYADFTVRAGDRVRFVLTWHPSHLAPPKPIDPDQALTDTETTWTEWASRCTYSGPYRDAVVRSLLTLKALTYAPTGGICAAATTSLPEALGGERNWDYRYCWLRDATMTLSALIQAGYLEEAGRWRQWLLRAIAGSPADLQIMYGVAGERRLMEWEAGWLAGYEGSTPVRIGNAAVDQLQLDVYGEVLQAMSLAREHGLEVDATSWALQRALVDHLAQVWDQPDEGIWETRGGRKNFTYSKVMAWVAMDRAVEACERFGRPGDVSSWRALREKIHAEVCERGFDRSLNSFTQYYDSQALDAALLLIPQVGFLPGSDPRVVGTVEAIERELTRDGLVLRYETRDDVRNDDGLAGVEGAFLACTFWLVDGLHAIGRVDDARALFERLLAIRGETGLLAEEYEPRAGRMLGNFPQAYSHIALVNSAYRLATGAPPAGGRA